FYYIIIFFSGEKTMIANTNLINTSQIPSVFNSKNVGSAAVGVTLTVAFVALPIFIAMPPVAVIIGATLAGGLMTYTLLSLATRAWKKWQINDLAKFQQACNADIARIESIKAYEDRSTIFDEAQAKALKEKYNALHCDSSRSRFSKETWDIKLQFEGAELQFTKPEAYSADYLDNAKLALNTLVDEISKKAKSLIEELR
ncbi:MAG: hypothetical protein KDK62_04270, partial [Chlamydiia bacterium]|nr:hypothetical protein [Chlamydiia bacterium]